jgi:anaerobic ribonucleoside-triphosphate reductase
MQSFVFGANVSSRWGSQCPFSNITLDWTVPEDMAPQKAIVGGKEQDFTYGDCKREMDMINKAFLEVMIKVMPTEEASSILFPHIQLPGISTGLIQRTTDSCSKWLPSTEHHIFPIILIPI